MKKIYYPDFKEKKRCMNIVAKRAPEYKWIKLRTILLATLCPLLGVAVFMYVVFAPNYWELVNTGKDLLPAFIYTMLILFCPMFAYTTWHKRFYNCNISAFMIEEKMFEQTEGEIKFWYHSWEEYETHNRPEKEKYPHSMYILVYPYEVIRKMKYDPEAHELTLTGAYQLEYYWDYEKGIKDEVEAPFIRRYDDTEAKWLLSFPEREEFLDYLYEKIKDTVWEPIEKTWGENEDGMETLDEEGLLS